jgi:hypothetical protein
MLNFEVMRKKTKFYTFNQNNSGGHFDIDDKTGISEFVFVEAHDEKEANERAESIGIYFDGCSYGIDCDCCGDRWYPVDDLSGCVAPTIFGVPVEQYVSSWCQYAFVHYLDGRFEKVWFKD